MGPSPAVRPQVGDFTSLSSRYFVCKVEIAGPYLTVGEIIHENNSAPCLALRELSLDSGTIVIIVAPTRGGGPTLARSERWDEGAVSWQSEDLGLFPLHHCPAVGTWQKSLLSLGF